MISFPLLKQTCKDNYKIWLFFTGILLLFVLITLAVYDSEAGMGSLGLLDKYPKEIIDAMGIDMQDNSFTGHLSNYLYGILFLIFPMIYIIITANRLVAGQVNNGAMAYVLSSPYNRTGIVFTQACYLTMSLAAMFAVLIIFEVSCIFLLFPGQMDWIRFLSLNTGLFCLHLCICGISFAASCVCDESRTSLMIGGGLPVLFYLLKMLAGTGGKLKYLRYVTIFTLYDTGRIKLGDIQIYWMFPALLLTGVILIILGITIFQKRDIPL